MTRRSELERLRAWKAEAMVVLSQWEAAWEAAGQPGALGSSKAAATTHEIRRISVLDVDQFKAMERRLAEAESVIDELQIEVSDLAEENNRFRKAFKTLRSELGGLL